MPTNRRIFSQDAAAATGDASSAQGLVLHLDANDEDSIESGGANTGNGSGTWFDIANHDLVTPLADKASNLQLHLNASDTTSYGGSGVTWTDISSNGGYGTITDPVFESGLAGGLDFNSASNTSGDKVEVAHNTAFNQQNNMSFEVWVKRDSTAEGNILFKGASGGYFFTYNTTNGYYFYSYALGGGAYSGTSGLSTGVYEHVVATIDGSGNKKIYVNGTLTPSTVINSATGTGTVSSTTSLFIGGYYTYAAHTGLDGRISVVRIYDTVLTASEVAQNFRAGNNFSYSSIYDTNLAMNLDPANYTSGPWADSAGSNNGTINDAKFDKELGNFFDFDGSNDTITVSATASAPVDFSSETYSIGMWANIETLANDKVLIGKFDTGSDRAFQIQITNSNKLSVLERGDGNFQIDSTQSFTTNTWFYFLYTRAASEAKIYVNGLLDTTASASQTINDAGTTDITIGNQVSTSEHFTGKIGQVKIYSATLTSAQVAQNYLATKNNYPNGYNATIDGATFSATTPAYFDLDGANDHIDTTFKNTALEEFTISAYIRFVTLPSTNKYFINDTTSGHEYSATFLLGYLAASGNWLFYIGNGSGTNTTTSVSSGLEANHWTHIVFTCDGINDTVKYYKNGSLSATMLDGTATNIGSFSNTGTMQLGRWAGVNNFHTDMDFGQFKIFNKTLSASEVLAEFNATKTPYPDADFT